MTRHHLIISGTGRAGTTFLVQLLTELGLDTGFPDATSQILPNCNAGMEWDIRHPQAPYIIKSPWLCDYLEEVLEGGGISVDHAIIPIRDLYSAAQSRRDVTQRTDPTLFPEHIPGGLWHTDIPEKQEDILAHQLYKLIYTLAKYNIPITLLYFPRFTYDPDYLYGQIKFALSDVGYDSYFEAFGRVARPELVHTFSSVGSLAAKSSGEN
jgi:hypothetical protein